MEETKNKSSYKLILMDINMPIMDGIEATGHIRRLEQTSGGSKSTVIALTAADTGKNTLREQYQELGFDCLIGKPLSKKSFQDLICKYLALSY